MKIIKLALCLSERHFGEIFILRGYNIFLEILETRNKI